MFGSLFLCSNNVLAIYLFLLESLVMSFLKGTIFGRNIYLWETQESRECGLYPWGKKIKSCLPMPNILFCCCLCLAFSGLDVWRLYIWELISFMIRSLSNHTYPQHLSTFSYYWSHTVHSSTSFCLKSAKDFCCEQHTQADPASVQ